MEKENLEKSSKIEKDENGTTTVIALLIMMLLMGFVTFALTRSANETIAVSNEISETKALFAAQASIENMALKADAKFENKLTLSTSDVTDIQNSTPANYSDYDFAQTVVKTREAEVIDATGEQFQGLKAIRDEWQVTTTATDKETNVKVSLRRRFFDNRIPIFQFGTFYEGDMNFFNPAPFNFGGRVHSNANIFIQSQSGLYFSSKVTAVGQILTNLAPNGNTMGSAFKENYIKDGAGTYKQLALADGSALASGTGANLLASYPLRPAAYRNTNWSTVKAKFNNNLLNEQKRLNLPLKPKYENLIKRGLNSGDKVKDSTGNVVAVSDSTKDGAIPLKERFYNKSGIRISLADSRDRLPGCAAATNNCGIQLDYGNGYQPVAMYGGEKSAKFNAGRFRVPGREVWIKIEIVTKNTDTAPTTKEITEDILSLGFTERPSSSLGTKFQIDSAEYPANADKYAIVKLQRFLIPGSVITSSKTYLNTFTASSVNYNFVLAAEKSPAPSSPLAPNKNPIETYVNENQAAINQTQDRFGCHDTQKATPSSSCNNYDVGTNQYTATVNDVTGRKVVPFPIMMFDTREGMVYDGTSGSGKPTPSYPSGRIPWAGVMSAVDIDINNLKLFLDGDTTLLNLLPRSGTQFSDSLNPKRALSNTDVSDSQGWVLYISDRRGDYDYDGEYDMEDLLADGTSPSDVNDGSMTSGEDPNNNGTLETDYINEAPKYSEYVSADVAACSNTRFFRRVVRLINGTTLPGKYDSANPENTKGLTIASENGLYVVGNFNTTGVSSYGTPTPSTNYLPQGGSTGGDKHIPAAIIADSITLLSNNWRDSYSFSSPFSHDGRVPTETSYRFGALVGKSKDWAPCVSGKHQGSDRGFECQSGGVHNLLRYLEDWNKSDSTDDDDVKSNYSGSIINLFNSFNSNSVFKCCTTVYEPPVRNYVFENSFLDVNRIPPGSPFLQSITLTGFERIND